MSIDRWMDKKAVVHIYNGVLLNRKKEHIWVHSNEVDEPGAYDTEWSESEKERQIPYINIQYGIQIDGTNDPMYRAAKETQM